MMYSSILKQHPAIRPLIRGGETIEYSAHMIPEYGYDHRPRIIYRWIAGYRRRGRIGQ